MNFETDPGRLLIGMAPTVRPSFVTRTPATYFFNASLVTEASTALQPLIAGLWFSLVTTFERANSNKVVKGFEEVMGPETKVARLEAENLALRNELKLLYDQIHTVDASRQQEIKSTYGMLHEVDRERVYVTERLNSALEELGPARFNSHHYLKLRSESRLIELDFPVHVRRRDFSDSPHMLRLVSSFDAARVSLEALLAQFDTLAPKLRRISTNAPPASEANAPYWMNDWVPGLDAISLYSFVALHKPRTYLEVGSGNSTRFVRQAIKDFGLKTRVVSIDPFPRADIDEICDEVHRLGVEDFDLSRLLKLTGEDIVFIDNSHRSFQNSDVTVFFMEMLGRLPRGCLYGLHDIFLPDDYPSGWEPRYYSEQYLLASYLFGGADGDKIVLPAAYLSNATVWKERMDRFWLDLALPQVRKHGGGFWLRKS